MFGPWVPEATFADAARAVKARVDCPVILVGGLRTVETMESVVREGVADFVSLARPLIREPQLVLTGPLRQFLGLITQGPVEPSESAAPGQGHQRLHERGDVRSLFGTRPPRQHGGRRAEQPGEFTQDRGVPTLLDSRWEAITLTGGGQVVVQAVSRPRVQFPRGVPSRL